MRHEVIGTDNRDQNTTVLILSSNDTVEIDPLELFLNMLENQEYAVLDEIIERVLLEVANMD